MALLQAVDHDGLDFDVQLADYAHSDFSVAKTAFAKYAKAMHAAHASDADLSVGPKAKTTRDGSAMAMDNGVMWK